jgi:hypothetical protein
MSAVRWMYFVILAWAVRIDDGMSGGAVAGSAMVGLFSSLILFSRLAVQVGCAVLQV